MLVALEAFNNFPKEAAFLGRLVLTYGELEWALCSCLSAVLDEANDEARLNWAGRIMYRTRGEEHRIILADAIMRPKYKKADLEPPYSEFIGDLGYCRAIRNQYAHCHWIEHEGSLCFFAFEEGAKKAEEFTMHARPVDADLLNKQERYFMFVYVGLMLLARGYNKSVGRPTTLDAPFPKKMDRPPLYNAKA